MINAKTFTRKTKEALDSANELAITSGHARVVPRHIASALISEPNGIFFQAISNVGGQESARAFDRFIKESLKKLPRSPSPDNIPGSALLMNVLKKAYVAQKSHGDTHLGVEHLILGILDNSHIEYFLKQSHVNVSKVKLEVEKLRTIQALKNYGRDLVEQAGKLDPVIGRDEEIRKVMRILSRMTKNNPVLIGEPGVGKTVVVEGLAQRIVK
jgi:ATP-dependent Clp protease ATP-binding subunit ClpB